MSNLSNCHHCNKPVCFERANKTLPEEYEVCRECDDHVCNDCVDWEYMNIEDSETPICRKCTSLVIKNSYEDGVCPDCGEFIPDDVVDGQNCQHCPHVFFYPRPDAPEV